MDDGMEQTPGGFGGVATDPEALCYDGERVVERAPLGSGWAAVTTHRVLAYNPATDGRRFEAVDRPNVCGIDVDASGDPRYLRWGLRAALYGLVGLGGGVALRALNVASTLSVGETARDAPVGGVLAVTDAIAGAVATLATLLIVVGVSLLVVAIGLLGRYLRTRDPALVVDRFGDDPVRLPAPRTDGERAASTLSAALTER
ncbi:hypothetical protein [Haloplanus salilacus]|uniref:hypothetical protein n=1 Tax=Haloplanus salilacus TaxID=2949994 RepID=UPI0030CA7A0A